MLAHNVPAHWIEQMDDETLTGWVWCGQLFDGFHVWDDMQGRPVKKPEKK